MQRAPANKRRNICVEAQTSPYFAATVERRASYWLKCRTRERAGCMSFGLICNRSRKTEPQYPTSKFRTCGRAFSNTASSTTDVSQQDSIRCCCPLCSTSTQIDEGRGACGREVRVDREIWTFHGGRLHVRCHSHRLERGS